MNMFKQMYEQTQEQTRNQQFLEAYLAEDPTRFAILGECLAEEVQTKLTTEGLRHLFSSHSLEDDQVNTTYSCGTVMLTPELIRGDDVMDNVLIDVLEAIFRTEDKCLITLLNTATTVIKCSDFDVAIFKQAKKALKEAGFDSTSLVLSGQFWEDIIHDDAFSNLWEKVALSEQILQGKLGTLDGVSIFTDFYRYPTLRIIDVDTSYLIAAPDKLGKITPVKELTSKVIEGAAKSRGWKFEQEYIYELLSSSAIVKIVKC